MLKQPKIEKFASVGNSVAIGILLIMQYCIEKDVDNRGSTMPPSICVISALFSTELPTELGGAKKCFNLKLNAYKLKLCTFTNIEVFTIFSTIFNNYSPMWR